MNKQQSSKSTKASKGQPTANARSAKSAKREKTSTSEARLDTLEEKLQAKLEAKADAKAEVGSQHLEAQSLTQGASNDASNDAETLRIFKQRLNLRRIMLDLSLEDFAEKSGLALSTLHTFVDKKSKRFPKLPQLLKMKRTANTSVAYLLNETDNPLPIPAEVANNLAASVSGTSAISPASQNAPDAQPLIRTEVQHASELNHVFNRVVDEGSPDDVAIYSLQRRISTLRERLAVLDELKHCEEELERLLALRRTDSIPDSDGPMPE